MSSPPKAAGRKRRNGLAAFRAVELEVHAALSAGRTVLAIYEEKRDVAISSVRHPRADVEQHLVGELPDLLVRGPSITEITEAPRGPPGRRS